VLGVRFGALGLMKMKTLAEHRLRAASIHQYSTINTRSRPYLENIAE
jgi:hypothetical protein